MENIWFRLQALTFQSGTEIFSQYNPDELTVEPEGMTTTTVTAQWVSGPGVDVKYQLFPYGDAVGVSIEPARAGAGAGRPRWEAAHRCRRREW